MRNLIIFPIIILLILIAGGFFVSKYWKTTTYEFPKKTLAEVARELMERKEEEKVLIQEALEKSSQIKGIYGGGGNRPTYFKNFLEQTELNGLVIDAKEVHGSNLSPFLKNLVKELHQKNVWVIARIVVFRDSSLIEERPEWYLTATSSNSLWQDRSGHYWLDPQNQEVQDYIIEFSKEAIDFGFNELQFDYIRYPVDGTGSEERCEVIQEFFLKLSKALKNYQPSIILSVDLFGHIAVQRQAFDIGQRLQDAGKYFDYISFMLYPSHFYGGFTAEGIHYSYPEVSKHPYQVVYLSILSASKYLSQLGSQAKIRPWLQDFDLRVDQERGVIYDEEEIRAQIEAAENATSSGWLLWNPAITYTESALEKE